jgi:hypothetical protein
MPIQHAIFGIGVAAAVSPAIYQTLRKGTHLTSFPVALSDEEEMKSLTRERELGRSVALREARLR